MDLVTDRLESGRPFRVLSVTDQAVELTTVGGATDLVPVTSPQV